MGENCIEGAVSRAIAYLGAFMKIKSTVAGALALSALGFCAPANASLVDAPVPSNAYIVYGGLDWAWASPIAGGIDLSYEGQFGWRLPTADELLNAPSAMQFIFAGANVPLGGSDPVSGAYFAYTSATLDGAAALASPYFTSYYHGDWCNAPGSACGFGEEPWAGQPGYVGYSESLVVRSAAGGVPEPATWAMLLAGFAGLGLAGYRTSRRSVALAA